MMTVTTSASSIVRVHRRAGLQTLAMIHNLWAFNGVLFCLAAWWIVYCDAVMGPNL